MKDQTRYESTEMRRVLFISYSFPPSTEMGAYTCAQIARYLPLYGWEPVVLTVKEKYVADPRVKLDWRSDADRASDSDLVIRTHKIPHLSDIYRRFKLMIEDRGSRIEDRRSTRKAILYPLSSILYPLHLLLSFSIIPDKYNGWLIPAVAAGLRAIKQSEARVIYSSAPYFTCHLAGYWLALLTGTPWVAHFRDPWVTGASAEFL